VWTIQRVSVQSSLNHLIRPHQHVGRNRQADLLSRFEIDDELELLRLLHREIGKLSAFEDLVHLGSGAPIKVIEVRPIGHKAALIDVLLP
jgi:hypothetical protein